MLKPARVLAVVLCLVLGSTCLITTTTGCGGGGGTPPPPPPPTVTGVAASDGPETGGTAITITGTNFLAGATVDVGPNAASAVVVVDATTITCTTPAGIGAVAVSVTTANGTGSLPAAFAYHPAPSLLAVGPPEGGTPGGRSITLNGTDFVNPSAGATSVTFGGAPAGGVVVVNGTTITCLTPPGAAGPAVDVVVTNGNGVGTLVSAFTYVIPILYAADGRSSGGTNPVNTDLYSIDVNTAVATNLTVLGATISAMAVSPDHTMLYFGGDSGDGGGLGNTFYGVLIPSLAGGGPIGPGTGVGTGTAGMDFVGNTLLAHTEGATNQFFTINTTTGVGTALAPGPGDYGGNAIAADWAGTVWFASAPAGPSTPNLYSVNPATGAATLVGPITGLAGDRVGAMTYLDGVLYALDFSFRVVGATLGTIDPNTAAFTPIGAAPQYTDALAGTVK